MRSTSSLLQEKSIRGFPKDCHREIEKKSLLNAIASSLEAIATSNQKLLGAKGIATRSKDATRAPGLTTRNKKLLVARSY